MLSWKFFAFVFVCGVSSDVPAFEDRVFASDFEFWIGVFEYQ